jgi:hypothetical protein
MFKQEILQARAAVRYVATSYTKDSSLFIPDSLQDGLDPEAISILK